MTVKNNITLIVIFLCSSLRAVPIEKAHEIMFPKLMDTIVFEDSDQRTCESGAVCKSFERCETSLTDWKAKKLAPKLCYFEGTEQFVCCRQGGDNASQVGTISKKSKSINTIISIPL